MVTSFLKEYLLDDPTYSEPGQDRRGSPQHIVMVFLLDLAGQLRGHFLVAWWPGAKDLRQSDGEGVPFLVCAEESVGVDAFKEAHVGSLACAFLSTCFGA